MKDNPKDGNARAAPVNAYQDRDWHTVGRSYDPSRNDNLTKSERFYLLWRLANEERTADR